MIDNFVTQDMNPKPLYNSSHRRQISSVFPKEEVCLYERKKSERIIPPFLTCLVNKSGVFLVGYMRIGSDVNLCGSGAVRLSFVVIVKDSRRAGLPG